MHWNWYNWWPTIKIVLEWLMWSWTPEQDEKIWNLLGSVPEWEVFDWGAEVWSVSELSNIEGDDLNTQSPLDVEDEAIGRLANMIAWNFDTLSIQKLVELLLNWGWWEPTPVDITPSI